MTDLQHLITAAETGTTAERAEALCKLGGMALDLAWDVVAMRDALSRAHKYIKGGELDRAGPVLRQIETALGRPA